MRALGPEEAELWAKVTATIRPLSRRPLALAKPIPITATPPPLPAKQERVRNAPLVRAKPPPTPLAPRPGTTLDGSWDRKISKGALEPDRILDLHGHNLDGAWHAIDQGLERAIASGDRVLLLITGHARSGEPPIQRGRIRAAVHDWLAHSRHARHIAAVRGAHPRHGGGGSLYLVLRRPG
ncbi:MAG: Smr/MutS family protein [Sphingomicrobium sp.]